MFDIFCGGEDILNMMVFKFCKVVMDSFYKMFNGDDVFKGILYSLETEGKAKHIHILLMFNLDFDYEKAVDDFQQRRV